MRARLPLLVLVALLAACGLQSTETYSVTGVVERVDEPNLQLRIRHDDIAGFMPAMTMNFDVADERLLGAVTAGDRVRFELERSATVLRITAIETLEPGVAGFGAGHPVAEPSEDPAPPFALVDQDGVVVRLDELSGRAVLLDFVFTRCPGPCPILTSAHVELQQALPPELAERTHFVSISIDPEYDTPERLRAYALERGADLGRWSFLTGEPDDVSTVVRAYGVGTLRTPAGELEHTVATFLIDPQGRIARRYLGLSHQSPELIADLREVLAQATSDSASNSS